MHLPGVRWFHIQIVPVTYRKLTIVHGGINILHNITGRQPRRERINVSCTTPVQETYETVINCTFLRRDYHLYVYAKLVVLSVCNTVHPCNYMIFTCTGKGYPCTKQSPQHPE